LTAVASVLPWDEKPPQGTSKQTRLLFLPAGNAVLAILSP